MSSENAVMGLERRNTLKFKIEPPRLMHLRTLVDFIAENWIQLDRISFVGKFGNILDLLSVDVQVGALTALAQFYDPPLRCFTFKNFQMAPTLEEYRKILGFPEKKKGPYCHTKNTPTISTIADVLGIPKKDLTAAVKVEEDFKGFPRSFLEGKVKDLHDKGKLKESMDVVALIIFGVVLFPHVDHFVDETAIDAFIAFKTQGMDPTTAVLADLYYELHMRHEKKGGRIRCCVPVLYLWLKNHLVKKGHPIGPKSNAEWATYLLSLSEESIIWYSREQEIKEVIYRCGDFPNVPLIGTIGCINYNPTLALRQLGAPMLGEPAGEELAAFIIHDRGFSDLALFTRVCQAWKKMIKKPLGRKSTHTDEKYRQWITARVQQVKLPFQNTFLVPEVPPPPPAENEEVEELKLALEKMEDERKLLRENLKRAYQDIEVLQDECNKKTEFLEGSQKKAKAEKASRLQTQGCLKAANQKLDLMKKELDLVLCEKGDLRKMWADSQKASRALQERIEDSIQQLKNTVQLHEAQLEEEKRNAEEKFISYHIELEEEREKVLAMQEKIGNQREVITWFDRETRYWMDRCSKLVWLADRGIQDMPELLEGAESAIRFQPLPRKVMNFIEYCKNLVEELEKQIRRDR